MPDTASLRLSRWQRLSVGLVILLLVGWVGWAGAERLSARFHPEPPRSVPPPAVEVHTVSAETALVERIYRGTVEAEQRARVSARLTARVLEIPHREGALVREGETLARLDDGELRLEAERLAAVTDRLTGEMATAQRDRDRQEDLHQQGMTTERALDDARQRFRTLEAQVRENAAALGLARLRLTYAQEGAPFDGVVQRVHTHEGEMAAVGQALVELVALDGLKAVLHLPQVDAPHIRPGLPVILQIQALGQAWAGRVDRIYPALDPADRSATFVAFLPADTAARPGMAVEARVALERFEQVVRLPAHAVRGDDDDRWVFVLEKGMARPRPVEIVSTRAGDYLVSAGLAPGETVIITADPRIRDGLPVRPAPMESP
jgi:membrane fusion protein, multidrug efflux system